LPTPLGRLITRRIPDVQAQARGVEIHLVLAALEDLGDGARVLELAQVDVAAALLDGIADELGGPRLALRPHHRRLLLLPCLVHDERCPLRFLLRYLLRFYRRRELRREGEVLRAC